ncbi:Dam family site-specific DNA-(adenine-N6)-methyltransferase [Candidatus Saccharibacteria bacterium]|nr:Dam family site-specific DNA-(adenine-N6)-methyltransferase [Candidatus Saccharibacteria bacterium]
MATSKYIKSPMNYTGGKFKLLNDIIPLFPKEINNFVDLFAGGLNVGLNVEAKNIYANDQITYLVDLYKFFQESNEDELVSAIKDRIAKYDLSKTNADGYKALRNEYNKDKSLLDLFVLTCYSFNHQIRFNNSHEFNSPFGKERSSYNNTIEANLKRFCSALRNKNVKLSSIDFRDYDLSFLEPGDLVYCDPPYLISTGSYNDGNRGFKDWTKVEDAALLKLLDDLNDRGVLFALSNVFVHKGMRNDGLIEWSKKYNVNYLDKTYSNCSYHFSDRNTKTVEVLVTNYGDASQCDATALSENIVKEEPSVKYSQLSLLGNATE